jgi:hypothetical protein
MTNGTLTIAFVAIALGTIAGIFGIQDFGTSTTISPTENSKIIIETQGDQLNAKGEVTQDRLNGQSRTTVEGTLSEDSATIKYGQEHRFDFPETENPLDGIGDTIEQIDETTQNLKEQYDLLAGN